MARWMDGMVGAIRKQAELLSRYRPGCRGPKNNLQLFCGERGLVYDEEKDVLITEDDGHLFTGQLFYLHDDKHITWVLNGKIHHPTKPAISYYGHVEYWLDGKHYSFEDFYDIQKNTKYKKDVIANKLGAKKEPDEQK